MKLLLEGYAEKQPPLARGDWVRTLTGGPPMEVVGLDIDGSPMCRLNGKVYSISSAILRRVDEVSAHDGRPRRGRPVGTRLRQTHTPGTSGKIFCTADIAAMRRIFCEARARLCSNGNRALERKLALAIVRSWPEV
ncbi:hypothetical protein [Phreatobacter sp.]|uniref:hypothetical protein n=1 Tax=Phreatobacter sp. TaxID=1966341 RepID=UPI0025CDCC31|nr:hypothetical protein [Phreatobacter sp.]